MASAHHRDAGKQQTGDQLGEEAAADAATNTKWGATGARTARAAGSPQSLARAPSAARTAGAGFDAAASAATSHAHRQEADSQGLGGVADEAVKREDGDAAPTDGMANEATPVPEVAAMQGAARPSGGHHRRRPR